MDETASNQSAAVVLTNSDHVEENIELSTSQEITALKSNYRSYNENNKEKSWNYKSPDGTITWCCCTISPKVAKYLEISALIISVIIVLMLLSTPIIIHIIDREVKNKQTNNNIANGNCSSYGPQTCSQDYLSWSLVPALNGVSRCHAEVYLGGVCSSFLSSWQSCALGESTSVFINNSHLLSEDDIDILKSFLSSKCQAVGIPFLCQYVFPLCDCSTGDLYLPSQEFCVKVSTVACEAEWEILTNFDQYGDLLPVCSNLPVATYSSNISGSGSLNNNNESNSSLLSDETVCSDQFSKINGSCHARCDSFEQNSHDVSFAVFIIELFAACFGLIIGIIVIIISFLRWKTTLTYPSIFLVYMTTGYCIIAFFVIITPIDQYKLYCTSVAITDVFNNSSPFCIISGAVFHYLLMNITLWWFFHVCSIFYKVMFPLKAKQYERKDKYIHLVLFLAGILIPIPGVLLALLVPDWGYIITRFPPLLCGPRNEDLWYFSTLLPLNILLAIGISLFVLMFWIVHKHQGIFRSRNKSKFKISTAERKILFVLCYYVVFGIVTLAYFGVSTADQDLFLNSLETYLRCEALGHLPNQTSKCNPKEYQQYVYPELSAISYLLMGFIPTANLAFVINWKVTTQKIMFCFRHFCYRKRYTDKTRVITTNFRSTLSSHPDVNINKLSNVSADHSQ